MREDHNLADLFYFILLFDFAAAPPAFLSVSEVFLSQQGSESRTGLQEGRENKWLGKWQQSQSSRIKRRRREES